MKVQTEWINAEKDIPPDCSSYAICEMYLISNDGFITVGFWYPNDMKWLDGNHKVNITNQVRFWMKLPSAPV